ncbi:MAG: hypothetical protein GY705_27865, partial [Bacteroidetes bacterium]|nr:hypothetical protein [Bacteroidota bacterium]
MAGQNSDKSADEIFALVTLSAEMILSSLALSTQKAYSKVVLDYNEFVRKLSPELVKFPVTPAHVSLFMSHLYRKGMSSSTITSKLSAIAFWHLIYGCEDPTAHFLVKRTLLGMKKSGPSLEIRPPISLSNLKKMIDVLPKMGWSKYSQIMIKAMLLIAFHTFLRPGEMTNTKNAIRLYQIS